MRKNGKNEIKQKQHERTEKTSGPLYRQMTAHGIRSNWREVDAVDMGCAFVLESIHLALV